MLNYVKGGWFLSLYVIGDLHLSLGTNKPMDVFNGWENYVERIKSNWNKTVADDDVVVVAGDSSWAMNLEDSYKDFEFLNNLNGEKIILKGNHDYWFTTKTKMDNFFKKAISTPSISSTIMLINMNSGAYAVQGVD